MVLLIMLDWGDVSGEKNMLESFIRLYLVSLKSN